MKEGDYVIGKQSTTRPFLAKVTHIKDDVVTVVPDKQRYLGQHPVELGRPEILVNLGKTPKPGKVYGVDVSNIYIKTIEVDAWGPIHFFVKPDKEHMAMLKAGLDYTAKKLEKMGLTDYMGKFQTEIRAKQGKWAGKYIHGEEGKQLVWYAPECADNQKAMNGIIFHEYGHVLRFNGLTRVKMRARWQRLFQQSIAPIVVPTKYLNTLLTHLTTEAESGSEDNLQHVLKTYVEDDEQGQAYVKALQRWMAQIHHVRMQELGVLWSASDFETLRSLWPKSSIDTSKLAPILTEYATKNVEELWAESFMAHCQGIKLPGAILKLLEKSLSEIKGNAS